MGCVECSTNNAGVALLGVADFTNLSAVEASPCCARDYLVPFVNEVRPRLRSGRLRHAALLHRTHRQDGAWLVHRYRVHGTISSGPAIDMVGDGSGEAA
jgi:hypothetical protein